MIDLWHAERTNQLIDLCRGPRGRVAYDGVEIGAAAVMLALRSTNGLQSGPHEVNGAAGAEDLVAQRHPGKELRAVIDLLQGEYERTGKFEFPVVFSARENDR